MNNWFKRNSVHFIIVAILLVISYAYFFSPIIQGKVLFQSDVEALIGKRPYEEKKTLDVHDENGIIGEPGEISAGVPPYDSGVTNKSLP